MRRLLPVALALLTTAAPAAEVKAVASFSILGDMVSRVGGDRVEVTTIVGPNADAHVYEPRPADAAALGASQVFFVNGLGFEGWLDRLVEATGFKGPVVAVSDGVGIHTMGRDGQASTDPHAWQNLANGQLYVANIARGLCAVDAAGCDAYQSNATAYAAELAALDAEVRAMLAEVPAADRKVITTHEAFGYFADAYGITFLAPEGISTDSEATAADVAKLIEQVRHEGVKALFVENMSDPRLIQQIAAETGATLGGELYSDALSQADQPASTYLQMFRHNAELIAASLRGR